jgi:predicted outer membrane lipoprotein
MIEKVQFWAVLLWMIGMLIMAAFAVRAVWLEADHAADEAGDDAHPGGSAPAKGSEPGKAVSQSSEPH